MHKAICPEFRCQPVLLAHKGSLACFPSPGQTVVRVPVPAAPLPLSCAAVRCCVV